MHAHQEWFEAHRDAYVAEIVGVCEVPAPTFAEAARGAYVRARLTRLGLQPQTDAAGNVLAHVQGNAPGPRTLLVAHLDTVFDAATDVTVRREGGRLAAPGVGDDSTSVAALLMLARYLVETAASFPGELLLGFTVGEEGLGNLSGMRALMDGLTGRVDQVVALDGELDEIVVRAVGSRRYRVAVHTPGGHSWADFGQASAVHYLADAVTRMSRLTVPEEPRTTFNVGTFHGGTTVNAIAAQAEFLLDLRSTDPDALADLEARALAVLDAWAEEVEHLPGCHVTRQQVGDRPAGTCDNGGMVGALAAAAEAGGFRLRETASSTDASVPMSLGIPAVCVGVYRGGGAHTLGEWVAEASLVPGLAYLARGVLALQARSQAA